MRDEGAEYDEVKMVLLKAVGETNLTYGHQLFELSGEALKAKSASEIMERIEGICRGVLQGCSTLEECVVALAAALTRRVIPQGGKVYLEGRKLTKFEDVRDAWETWMSGRMNGNFYKTLGSVSESESRSFSGFRGGYGESSGSRVGGVVTCFTCGEKGHRSHECRKGSSGAGYQPRPVTCFSCGKAGHRSIECPGKKVGAPVKKEPTGKVSKIIVGSERGNVVRWLVNGVSCKVLIDSGAEVGVVPRAMVSEGAVRFGQVHISDVHGRTSVHQSTVVEYVIGGLTCNKLAVIEERVGDDVMCIIPFDVMNEEEVCAFRRALELAKNGKSGAENKVSEAAEVSVLTRSQARLEQELDKCEPDIVSEDLWSSITPGGDSTRDTEDVSELSNQPDPLMMPEVWSRVGEGHGVDDTVASAEVDKPQAKGDTEVESVDVNVNIEGKPRDLEREMVCEDEGERRVRELASEVGPVRVGKDGKEFREELLSDESLSAWRELGDNEERGFAWRKGVLVRRQYVSWEEFRDVIVVPSRYRKQIMFLGHERNGHLSGEKVAPMVGRYFLWPGMVRELVDYCRSCSICQLKSKQRPARAPIVERPILTEPFE